MPKALGNDDNIAGKIERYKGRKNQWDLLVVIPSVLAGETPAPFWSHTIAAGSRPDGSRWVVNLNDDDPSQNVALEMGGKAKESVAAFVLHLVSFDGGGSQPRFVGKAMPWTFGGDKWSSIKMLGLQTFQSGPTEILVTCSATKEEKYQDLVIQFAPPERRMYAQLLNNPDVAGRLKAEIQREYPRFIDFTKPTPREDQIRVIQGQQGGGSQMPGQPAPPSGMDMTGLPGPSTAPPTNAAPGNAFAPGAQTFTQEPSPPTTLPPSQQAPTQQAPTQQAPTQQAPTPVFAPSQEAPTQQAPTPDFAPQGQAEQVADAQQPAQSEPTVDPAAVLDELLKGGDAGADAAAPVQ